MNYKNNILDLIGKTPLVSVNNGIESGGPLILLKLEFLNPGGSVKDRMAAYILKKAMDEGRLKPGDTIIDNTSGNTGVAMAMVASILGLKAVLTTPEKTSKEKVDFMKSFGAEVIITRSDAAHEDPDGCYMMAINLARENGYFHMNQYHNQDNVEAHYLSTGPEIWEDTNHKVTHFIAGIGTGGTFSGTAKFLKEKNPAVRAIAVDPVGSIFADYIKSRQVGASEAYKVEGIGSDCITEALHPHLVDEVVSVSDADAFETARRLSREEGISVGGSTGAAVWAARRIGRDLDDRAVMVVIAPDSGSKYLSKCFNDIWMKEQGFLTDKSENKKLEV
ncbi:MAG: cystathionine beta-synthase [candidate division Zixibacteria bacterium HGW-Zixibacteria-1]|nr:MAG: cystathionine beta-synthase [candidate division Zixibacteria bacterium HGW-Zixibacteria-1]